MPVAILIALLAGPVVLLTLLRVNASLVFLSLCLGDVLVQLVGGDAASVVAGAGTNLPTTGNIVKLVLLLLPAILTTLFMIKTVKKSRRVVNVIPALGTGMLTTYLVVPLLSPGLSVQILQSAFWSDLASLRSAIISASAILCLLFLWLSRPKNYDEKHSKKH